MPCSRTAYLRLGDTIARLGGDQFTVLLENVPGKNPVIAVAERIEVALAAPFELEGSDVLVSAGVGIAMIEAPIHSTPENLLRAANVAMHDASAITALQELKDAGGADSDGRLRYGLFFPLLPQALPRRHLKIDRSYIDGLGSDAGDTAIVHATIAFAKELDLNVTAEGIENAEQLARLRELGCELGQGHHFARPLPSDEATELLASGLLRQPF